MAVPNIPVKQLSECQILGNRYVYMSHCEESCWNKTLLDYSTNQENQPVYSATVYQYNNLLCPDERRSVHFQIQCRVAVEEDENNSDVDRLSMLRVEVNGGFLCGNQDVCCRQWLSAHRNVWFDNVEHVRVGIKRTPNHIIESNTQVLEKDSNVNRVDNRNRQNIQDSADLSTVEHTVVLNDDDGVTVPLNLDDKSVWMYHALMHYERKEMDDIDKPIFVWIEII